MSRRTIRMLDLIIDVENWERTIKNVREDLSEFGRVWPRLWVEEAVTEIEKWSKSRDKTVARLRKLIASFDDQEIDLIRRRYPIERIVKQLNALGIEMNRWRDGQFR